MNVRIDRNKWFSDLELGGQNYPKHENSCCYSKIFDAWAQMG